MNAERPSLIADEPAPISASRRPWSRWLGAVAAVLVLGGFGAGVGYVYWYVTRAGDGGGSVPLVRAETGPIRARPDNPGGQEVPHQNIDVFNRIGQPAPTQGRPPVERLLPPPEPPMPRPPAASEARPLPAPQPAARPPLTRDQAQPAPAGPGPVAQAPAPPPQQPAQARPPQTQLTNPQTAAIPPGGVRVQLGSLRSQEAANTEIQRLRRGQPELLRDLTMVVVRGEVAGQGTFFRVHAGPLRDRAAADQLCQTLTQRRVGCQVVP